MSHREIGVLALQGDVSEHRKSLIKAGRKIGIEIQARDVKRPSNLESLDALLIPGGESTTIGRLLSNNGLDKEIIKKAEKGLPLLGTCAGMVLLSQSANDNPFTLGLMNMSVIRNAFGRQRESFEIDLEIDFLQKPYHAVFIRSPAVQKAEGNCEIKASLAEGGVVAIEDSMMALSFHPELTNDTKVQEYFIREFILDDGK